MEKSRRRKQASKQVSQILTFPPLKSCSSYFKFLFQATLYRASINAADSNSYKITHFDTKVPLLQSDSCKQNERQREREAVRLTVDQSRESRQEQSHRVPHPGGEEQEDRGGRRGEAPGVQEGGGGGGGGMRRWRRRRGGRRGRTDSGCCWKSLGLHPAGIGGKECERVLEERGAERGRGGRREKEEEEEEMGAVSAPSLSLSLSLFLSGRWD